MLYQFNQFTLDTDSLELKRSGELVEVEPQVFSLIACLIENSNRVVTKDEIIEIVWDGRIVSDGTLNSRINAARRAVGDDGKAQAVIKTFPRRGFRWVAETGEGEANPVRSTTDHEADKPSIFVLPFFNLSGDPEQDYFSDGITEDIITALARVRHFFVIARNTTFTYKGKAVDVPTIAKELAVQFVLEGSVRKAGDRVRITVQLNDGETGNQIWAEHYDRDLEDIFAVQDEITQMVVASIEPMMAKVERSRVGLGNTKNLDAWDYYHRGMSHMFDKGEYAQPKEMLLARENFIKAIELDATFSRAYSGFAHCAFLRALLGSEEDTSLILEEGLNAAKNAIKFDQEDAYAHSMLGLILSANRQANAALQECQIALEINPNFPQAYFWFGTTLVNAGRAVEAIEHLETAVRIGIRDPGRGPAMAWLGLANLFLGEYEKSVEWAQKALRNPNTQFLGDVALTVALINLDRTDEASLAKETLQNRRPSLTCSFFKDKFIITDPGYQDILIDGLRKAGVPEE